MKKVISAILVLMMLVTTMSVSAFAAAAATRRTVQITIPAELLEQLAADGFAPSRVRLNKLDEASTRMAIFETDPAVVEIEIGPNELLCYQYIGETQFYEAIWFLTDDLIKAADGDGIVDVGAADRPYGFNPEVYFNGAYKATVKWVDGTGTSTSSNSSSSSSSSSSGTASQQSGSSSSGSQPATSTPPATEKKSHEGDLTSESAEMVKNHFGRWFTNNEFVCADYGVGEPLPSGSIVDIALGDVKVDLTKAVFYSYNREENSYTLIAAPGASIEGKVLTLSNVGTHGTYLMISLNGEIDRSTVAAVKAAA